MKKLSKFWKIYIFSITAFVLVASIALGCIYAGLVKYEADAQEKKEEQRLLAIEKAEQEAKRKAELLATEELRQRELLEAESLRRLEYLKATKEALNSLEALRTDMAHAAHSTSALYVVESFVKQLNSEGCGLLAAICTNKINKYEFQNALIEYLSSLGEFTAGELNSSYAELYAGGKLICKLYVTAAKTEIFGFVTYEISSAEALIPQYDYTLTAPHGSVLHIGEYDVTEISKTYTESRFDGIPKKYGIPQTDEYILSGFIYEPEFSATVKSEETDENGVLQEIYTPLPYNRTNGQINFLPPFNESYFAALSDRAMLLATKYGDFVAGDIEFPELKPFMLRYTSLYNVLAGYDNNWYYAHSYMENTRINLIDFIVYSPSLVYARVQYRQLLYNSRGGVLRRVDVDFEVYMVCTSVPDIPEITQAETETPGFDTYTGTDTPGFDTYTETDVPSYEIITETEPVTEPLQTDTNGEPLPIPPEDLPYADWIIAALYTKQ